MPRTIDRGVFFVPTQRPYLDAQAADPRKGLPLVGARVLLGYCGLSSRKALALCGGQMSLFRQHAAACAFPADESWVILSPIEASIKRKIEAVGTPLSEWDIHIYRGVLTGCNEAFIIPTARRDEILAACRDEAERERTAELIRPILRGRDIKRYGYEWAELWLIATFPSRHYDIEQYPAVRDYLLSFGREKLEQTGATYTRDGQEFKARKKTNNQWFETQDSISYWVV